MTWGVLGIKVANKALLYIYLYIFFCISTHVHKWMLGQTNAHLRAHFFASTWRMRKALKAQMEAVKLKQTAAESALEEKKAKLEAGVMAAGPAFCPIDFRAFGSQRWLNLPVDVIWAQSPESL